MSAMRAPLLMPLALTVLAAAIAAWDEQPIRLILDTGFEDALAPFTPHPGHHLGAGP